MNLRKIKTRELTATFEKTGKLPDEEPVRLDGGSRHLYRRGQRRCPAQGRARMAIFPVVAQGALLAHRSRTITSRCWPISSITTHDIAAFTGIRTAHSGPETDVATCAEFGPRFLHSTGQAYKGGPDSGIFLQITADDANGSEYPRPGKRVSVSSRLRRRAAISTCLPGVDDGPCTCISRAICSPVSAGWSMRSHAP